MVVLRRAGAYGVDYLVIAAYALALAAVMITLVPPLDLPRTQAWLFATATLTAPVVLAFTLMEAAAGLSPGKALLGLRVGRDGARPGFGRALVRNLFKFAPWELAHAGIWLTPGQPFIDPPGVTSLVLMNAAMALVVIQAGLIAAFGAGVHDWIAGARVVRR
ncbi:MAG: RDD family protein [Oceanicaulis sp.]